MCHQNNTNTESFNMQSKRIQQESYERIQNGSIQTKLINQLRPFRKVAKSTKINLNRYWGILSQRYNNKSKIDSSQADDVSDQFAQEMEQNRINELLEAQVHASSQNSLNSQYEEYSLRSASASSISSGSAPCIYNSYYPAAQLPSPCPSCDCHSQRNSYASTRDDSYVYGELIFPNSSMLL